MSERIYDPVSYYQRVQMCIARLESAKQQTPLQGKYVVPPDLVQECLDCFYDYFFHDEPLEPTEDELLR